jgi:hypothetical protein
LNRGGRETGLLFVWQKVAVDRRPRIEAHGHQSLHVWRLPSIIFPV